MEKRARTQHEDNHAKPKPRFDVCFGLQYLPQCGKCFGGEDRRPHLMMMVFFIVDVDDLVLACF
jgi:hypothetical protein